MRSVVVSLLAATGGGFCFGLLGFSFGAAAACVGLLRFSGLAGDGIGFEAGGCSFGASFAGAADALSVILGVSGAGAASGLSEVSSCLRLRRAFADCVRAAAATA